MTTSFVVSGNNIFVRKINDDFHHEKHPLGVYEVNYNQMMGFYTSRLKDKFEIPSKVYGKANERIARVSKSYENTNNSLGVIFSGNSGMGKTITAELMCNHFAETYNLPVIIIDRCFDQEDFLSYIHSLGEVVLMFDEFGKKWGDSDSETSPQDSLLTLFDGLYSRKRLVIMTENDEMLISRYILNRPSRAKYHFKYLELEEAVITALCAENDIPSEAVHSILKCSKYIRNFSAHVLKTIIQEWKLFGSEFPSIDAMIEDMNFGSSDAFSDQWACVSVSHSSNNRKNLKCSDIVSSTNLFKDGAGKYVDIQFTRANKDTGIDEDCKTTCFICSGSFVEQDMAEGTVTLLRDGFTLVFKKHQYK